jgi:SAM-dependent methyltransferase
MAKQTFIDSNKLPPIEGMRLNIGSGKDYKKGFINIDKFDKTADANWDIEHLPLNDSCVAQIVCSDVLEHLPYKMILPVLIEFHRVLKHEGQILIFVPDIGALCKDVSENPEDEWKLAQLYGNQQHEGQFHKTGFTVKRLSVILGYAGFDRLVMALYPALDGLKMIYMEAYRK